MNMELRPYVAALMLTVDEAAAKHWLKCSVHGFPRKPGAVKNDSSGDLPKDGESVFVKGLLEKFSLSLAHTCGEIVLHNFMQHICVMENGVKCARCIRSATMYCGDDRWTIRLPMIWYRDRVP